MKKLSRGLFIIILSIMALGMGYLPVSAQDNQVNYDITHVELIGDITAEGDVLFTETQTYDIKQLNGVIYQVDLQGVNLGPYRVGVKDPETGKTRYFEESTSRQAGTFQTQVEDDLLKFTVFYPSQNEKVDFVFEYRLENLITNYQDTAELNRKLLGTGTDENFDVDAEIILPGKVEQKNDFRAWLYGDPQGQIQLDQSQNQSRILVSVLNQSANQFLEVQAIFPTALTPNNQNRVDQAKKEAIINQANAQVEQDRADYQKRQGLELLKLVALLAFAPLLTLYSFYLYFHHKKRLNPNPKHVPDHIFNLPAEISPAIMAASYLNRPLNADDFSATIVDLARKGYLDLGEEAKHQRTGFFNRGDSKTIRIRLLKEPSQQDQLQKHELYVLEYLFTEDQDEVKLSEIETAIHQHSQFAKRQNRLWTRFKNFCQVMGQQAVGESLPYRRKVNSWIALSLLASILVWPLLFFFLGFDQIEKHIVLIVLLLSLNFILILILFFMNRKAPLYSQEEDYQRRMWRAFAKMLEDIGQFNMREIASLPLWDEYLVYAISLGVADKVIEAMNKQYGMDELNELALPTPFYNNPYLLHRALRTTMSSSIAAAHPKTAANWGKYQGSNIGGFGGGASSGSSGGSGGRGGMGGF